MFEMDKKSKMFLVTLAFIITISIVITYYRYVITQDIEYYTDEEAFSEALSEE